MPFARDLVLVCTQNLEHVCGLHALCEAIGYLCRCRYPVDAVSSFRGRGLLLSGRPLPYACRRHRISIGVWRRALFAALATRLRQSESITCGIALLLASCQSGPVVPYPCSSANNAPTLSPASWAFCRAYVPAWRVALHTLLIVILENDTIITS